MLAHGLLILGIEFRKLGTDDLAHAHLRQLLRHEFFIEETTLDRGLVLHEGGDHLVEVFLTDTLRMGLLGSASPLISIWNWPLSSLKPTFAFFGSYPSSP